MKKTKAVYVHPKVLTLSATVKPYTVQYAVITPKGEMEVRWTQFERKVDAEKEIRWMRVFVTKQDIK